MRWKKFRVHSLLAKKESSSDVGFYRSLSMNDAEPQQTETRFDRSLSGLKNSSNSFVESNVSTEVSLENLKSDLRRSKASTSISEIENLDEIKSIPDDMNNDDELKI